MPIIQMIAQKYLNFPTTKLQKTIILCLPIVYSVGLDVKKQTRHKKRVNRGKSAHPLKAKCGIFHPDGRKGRKNYFFGKNFFTTYIIMSNKPIMKR